MALFPSKVNKLERLYTIHQLTYHNFFFPEFQEVHNQMFHNKFFLMSKLQLTNQNHKA